MSITDARKYVTVSPAPVNQGGYLGSVPVLEAEDHAELGAEYETLACTKGNTWADICYIEPDLAACTPGTVTPPADGFKQFEATSLVQGDPRPIYAGIDCTDPSDGESSAKAREAFSYAEPRLVDEMVVAWLEANQTGVALTAASIESTIAQFEDIVAGLYGGYGVISLSRGAATQAAGARLVHRAPDGSLETVNGTKVVAYATSNPLSPSEAFVTGRITLIRGQLLDRWTPEVTIDTDNCYPARQLAERIYVPLVECVVQKGLVNDPT